MPNPRTLLLVLALLAGLVVAPVAAKPPKAYANISNQAYPDNSEAAAAALDPQGRFAFVAMRPDPNVGCGANTLVGAPLPCNADVVAWDLDRATRASEVAHGQSSRPSQDATLPVAIAVTPAGEGTDSSGVYAVKAGPGSVFSVSRASASSPAVDKKLPTDKPMRAAAITADNARVVVAGGDLTSGQLFVWNCCAAGSSERWSMNFTRKVNDVAISRDGSVTVVGTDDAVYVLKSLDSKPATTDYWTRLTQSPVRDVDVSDDGSVVVAGTGNGEVYYFLTKTGGQLSQTTFESYFSAKLDGGVTAVAVTGDGKWFAAVTSSKEFALWQARAQSAGAVAVLQYEHNAESAFTDVDASHTGTTFVAAGGSQVLGYTTGRQTPAWTLPLVDEVRAVAVSADANQVVAASKTRFYAWMQTSEVLIEGLAKEKHAQPTEVVPYSFTLTNAGSLQDNYSVVVQKPGASWVVEGERQFELLAPDTSARLEFTLQPPATERPARHMGWIEVFSQVQNRVVHREYFNVSVAQVVNLRLTADQGDTLELNQGEEFLYTFKIINQGNSYARLNVTSTQAPTQGPSWTITGLPDRELNLTEGSETSITASIIAPRDAVDGTCNKITFAALSGRTGATLQVVACVNPQYQLAVSSDLPAVAVKPGESAIVKLRVENRGNTDDTVTLETSTLPTQAALDWRISVDPPEFDLPRGGVRTATLSIRAAVAEPPEATVTVRALGLGGTPQSVSVTASLFQEVESPGAGILAAGAAVVLAAAALALGRRNPR